jgi:uncharacterized membrane protein
MTHRRFTSREVLSFAWEKTKDHYWLIAQVAFICIVISGAVMHLPLLNAIINGLLSLAVISVSFAIVEGRTPALSQMLRPFGNHKIAWHAFLATLLCMLIVLAGLIVFILPGIYLAVRLKFYIYFIMEDENLSATDSLRKSFELTRGVFWKLLAFNIILAMINILGLLVFGIGLLFTIPVSIIAYTHLYKKLSVHQHEEHPHHETSSHIA